MADVKMAESTGFGACGIKVFRADGRVHDVGIWSYTADNWIDQLRWYGGNWRRLLFWRLIFALEVMATRLISFSEWLKEKRAR